MIFNFNYINLVVSLCLLEGVRNSHSTEVGVASPKRSRRFFGKITKQFQRPKKNHEHDDSVAEEMKTITYGQYWNAIKSFTEEIRKTPEEPSNYVQRANCFVEIGRFRMAFTDFKLARSLATESGEKKIPASNPTYLTELGRTFLKKQKFEEANWCFTESLDIFPNDIMLYKMRGDTYRNMNEYEKAIVDYKTALTINENDEYARQALILPLYVTKRFDELRENVSKLDEKSAFEWGENLYNEKRFKTALMCFDEVIKKYPENERHFEMRGKTHVMMGKIDLAISDFKEQVRLMPTQLTGWFFLMETLHNSERMDQVMKEIHVLNHLQLERLGKSLCDAEKFEEARRLFDKAIECNSSVASHFRERGLCHSKMGNWNLAISDLRTGVGMDLNFKDNHLYQSVLSESLYEAGKYEEAVKEMILASESVSSKKRIEQERIFREKLENLASKLLSRNEFILAISCYTELLKDFCSTYSTWKYYLQRGICHQKLKNFEDAISEYIKVIEYGKDMRTAVLPVLFDLFELLIDVERYQEALDVLEIVEVELPSFMDNNKMDRDFTSRILTARKKIRTMQKGTPDEERNNKNSVAVQVNIAIKKRTIHFDEALHEEYEPDNSSN